MKLAIILGTRPEIIKMSPVIKELQKRNLDFFILHTNQHYSENLDKIFFDELELPNPKYNLNIGSCSHAQQIGKMLIGIEKILIQEKPDMVLVQGDTNSVLAGALSAKKLCIKVAHIEAGLRSYSQETPEEANRIIADHCSDFLFAPTEDSKKILLNEGFSPGKIFITGNTIVDAVYKNLELSKKKSDILEKLGLKKENYLLLTLHRQENVDNKKRLRDILYGLDLVHKKIALPIIFPLHPRTGKMIRNFKLNVPGGITFVNAVGFLDFLSLQSNARLIFTDSGGVQEESCILKVPCVTLRDNTERPETLKVGSNILAGVEPGIILRAFLKMINKRRNWKIPFGNGTSAEKIIKIILNEF